MIIYSPIGIQILDAPVTKEAIVIYALMSDYYIELPFNQSQYIQIPQGSYIHYKGRKFEIMAPVYPEFDNSTGGYKYALQFQAQQNHMKRFVCFWLGGPNPEAVFHNTTDLASFGALIVNNMNKALGTDNWRLGTVTVENSEAAKLVSFNGDKCWDAVNTIAETFEVEWWTEENGDIVTLNFGKMEFGTPEPFKRGDVVKSIPAKKGDDSSYGTRFYVFGSTRNLTSDYGQAEQGGITNHVSEVRLRLPNGQEYIDAIPNLTKDEIVEQVVFFNDVYPKNTETVSSVETIDRDIIEGQKDKAYVMVCPDTPFVPSDVIAGATLGAHFTSGDLMGWDFELALIDDNNNNIDPATWKPEDGFNKKFEIIAQVETSGGSEQIIPNEHLKPEPDDTFVLTGVKLPTQRIDEAEQELLAAGTSYAAKHSSDTDVYDCETNPIYCQNNDKNYEGGQAVRLVDPRFGKKGRLSRIQGYEKKLYNEYIATYTVGDNTPYSRLGSIESDVKASLYSQRIGVTENGASIYLITRYDDTFPLDSNAYSARRAMWQFANKQTADTFKGRMTFDAGAQFGNFAGGINGIGGFIDNKGNAEMDSLKLRRFLEVPELRYNRVDVTMGDTWFAPCAGIIQEVDVDNQVITLKLEDGEIGSPRVGDICMGIFHSNNVANNAASDFDDGKGNRGFAGFATCYFRITEILDTTNYSRFKYQLRPVSDAYPKQYHPTSSMTFVGYGSFSNADRRTSRYETRSYQRYLRGVSDWEFTAENIAAQFGDLTNLSVFGLAMSGYSAYLNNIYMQGMLRSLDRTFIIDTKTRSLLMASGETGIGLAFNPQEGLKIGTIYDPATGRFQKEYNIEEIKQTADETKEGLVNLQFSADNIINGSHEDYIVALTAVPIMKINHELIRGKLITYRAELKGENALGRDLGFEIQIHFKDNTDQWIRRFNEIDIPDRGNFEKVYTFSSQIEDKEIEYAIFYPVFRPPTDDEVPRKLYIRREFVGVGSKLPSTWSPSLADRQAAVDAAQQAANEAVYGVYSLKNFTDNAFADGIIDRAEAASIEKYINSVSETKDAVDASYTIVYGNSLLGGSAKQNLQAAKSAFDTAVANLLASISTASVDGIATAEEKAEVDAKYALFNTAYSTYTTRIEEAQRYIQTAINTTAQGAYRLSQELQAAVNTLNESIIPDLQNQIDRQIVSYNGTVVPTLSNYPASEWTSTEERNRHINDYYDRRITVNGAVAYERYKFVLENNVYQWVRIADSGAAAAQAKAIEALGVAGSKNKVYFGNATPSVPYAINDLWIKTSGDIYLSNADRLSGATGSPDDWQLVNDAQLRLRQMSSDNVISKEEKASLRNTLAQREKEMVEYKSDASKYDVSISALNTAYLNLVNFLTGTIAVNNDTDTDITSDQRTSYNTYFASYDTEVSRFTNLVADKRSKAYTDKQVGSLQENIDAAKQAADAAQIAADKAQSDANAANAELAQIRQDGVVSPTEKKDLKLQQADIQAEYAQIVSEAEKYGITTSAYTSSYTAANAALTKYTASTPDYIATGDDYANITNYYSARQTILDAIATAAKKAVSDAQSAADAAKEAADAAQQAAEEAQKSADAANTKLTEWASDNVISPTEKTGLKLQQADIQGEYAQIVNEGSEYQLSTAAYVSAYRAAITALTKYTALSPELIPIEDDYASIARYYAARGRLLGMIAEAAKKIIDDTVSAVNDIDYIKLLFPTSLEIDGAVISRVLAVRNDSGTAITGFFNGSATYKDSTHGICMIATGMNDLANWNTAKTRIYADGAIITDKLIASNANISGNITASSGKIGGFQINDPDSNFNNPSLNYTTPSQIPHGNYSIELGGWGMAVARGIVGSNFDDRVVMSPAGTYKGFPPNSAIDNVAMGMQAYSSVLYKSNIALMLNAGTAPSTVETIPGNHALYISKGDICGFRLRTRTMTSGTNAMDMDSIIFSEATAATGVTLPVSPQDGQIYLIRKVGSGNISVWVGNQSTQNIRKNYNTSAKYVNIEYGHLGIFMWNEKGNYWTANYCSNM